MRVLEICCDASMRTFNNGRSFGCAGAIAIGLNRESIRVVPDCTNNMAELVAMLLAVQLAYEINIIDHYDEIYIYSDSIFTVKGLTVWMESWLMNQDALGIMYNSSGIPVANQDMFKRIITFLVINNLHVHIRHIKGHVNVTNQNQVDHALQVFYNSNRYRISLKDITRILLYNNIIDNKTRNTLQTTDQNMPVLKEMANFAYVVPSNYKDYTI